MTRKALNRSLHAAKATKQDEFYTQLSDIEKELKHYQRHFKNKTVRISLPGRATAVVSGDRRARSVLASAASG